MLPEPLLLSSTVPGSATVHAKVLPVVPPVEAASGRLTEPQVVTVSVDVIVGVGYTVTVIVVGDAARQPPMLAGEVGCTV